MSELLTYTEALLQPHPSTDYREEIIFSPADAMRYGIRDGDYGILKSPEQIPDIPDHEEAVRLMVGTTNFLPNTLLANSFLFEKLGLTINQEWKLFRANSYLPVRKIVLEPSIEHEKLSGYLKRVRRSSFLSRCLLAKPEESISGLKLFVAGQAFFRVHDIDPAPSDLREPTVLGTDDRTEISLFVPHRKGGTDMVVLVDASKSMEVRDYRDHSGAVYTRIEAAYRALNTLLTRRLWSGSRVSRFALVAFAMKARVVYPPDRDEMVELTPDVGEEIRKEIPNLASRISAADREASDVSGALDKAFELLYINAAEDNEKVVVLLSDGAEWVADSDTDDRIRIGVGEKDAVLLADTLYDQSKIHIHTIAISNEDNLRFHRVDLYMRDIVMPKGKRVWLPNPEMLSAIAQCTHAKFFPSPDADVLNKLFDELGQGALFPLL